MWVFNIWILLLWAPSKIFQTPKNGSSTQEILGNAASSIFLLFCGHVLGVLLSKRHSSLAWRGLEDITLPPLPLPRPPVRATYLNLASFQRNSHWLLQMVYHWYISVIHIWLAECFISTLQKVKTYRPVIFGSLGKGDLRHKKWVLKKTSFFVKNHVRCSIIAFFYLCVPTRTEMFSYKVSRYLKLNNLNIPIHLYCHILWVWNLVCHINKKV